LGTVCGVDQIVGQRKGGATKSDSLEAKRKKKIAGLQVGKQKPRTGWSPLKSRRTERGGGRRMIAILPRKKNSWGP